MSRILSRASLAVCVASLAPGLSGSAWSQGVASLSHAAPYKPAPRPSLPSERFGLGALAQNLVFVLPGLDRVALELQDDAHLAAGDLRMRIGVAQDLVVGLADHPEGWQAVPGGRLWRVAIVAPTGVGLRLELADLELASGAQAWVGSLGSTGRVQGPFTGDGPFNDGHLWTTDLWGKTAFVEVFEPEGASTPSTLSVIGVHQHYRDVAPTSGPDPEGGCHPNVLCYPAWHPLHESTARITFIEMGATFLCSATLLNSQANDRTPYLMTANHCVVNNVVAPTVTAYWFYQTNGCGPGNMAPATSVNATLLRGDGQVDISLMMLNGALPGGAVWAGWTLDSINNGVDVGAIHHPAGARKKIALGDKHDHTFGDQTRFFGATWTQGTIEGGSSGCGLYRSSDKRFIGVCSHTAIPPGCVNPPGPSGFGKLRWFHANIPGIAGWLASGWDDAFEPNDSCAAATALNLGNYPQLHLTDPSPQDWYRLDVPACHELTVATDHVNAWGDLDIELFEPSCGALVGASTGNGNDKSLSWTNSSTQPRSVYLRVFLGSGNQDTRADYGLSASTAPDPLCSPLGTRYCDPAVVNSTGSSAVMTVQGSNAVLDNDLTLVTSDLPPNQFGFFLLSQSQANVPMAGGSFGTLCLGAPVGRFNQQILNSGSAGEFSLAVDLSGVPTNPAQPVVAGQTWNFQAWYRDFVVIQTSNFSDALSVFFV